MIIIKEDCKFWYNLRHKQDKTYEEMLLLKLRKTIANISEYLISYDKGHYSQKDTLEKIRKEIKETN